MPRSYVESTGVLATARTWPVDACTATRAAGWLTPARACSAAVCTCWSSVVRTGCPDPPLTEKTRRSSWPPASATAIEPAGEPATRRWYTSSRPERPTSSVSTNPGPARLSASAVAGPTLPRTARANVVVGARSAFFDWKTIPGTGSSVGRAASKAGRRRVMTETKTSGLAAPMAAFTRLGSAPVVRWRTARAALTSLRRLGTTPTTTTGAEVTSGIPLRSSTGARGGSERDRARCWPATRSGPGTASDHRTSHLPPSLCNGRRD